jgi:hypothetical protein
MVRNTAATMSTWVLGRGEKLADEVDRAALVAGALESARQCRDQAGVLLGDCQPHPAKAAFLQPGQECPPEHLVLAVADVPAEDLPAAVGGDRGGDHHGLVT